jgi:hypothetical protein
MNDWHVGEPFRFDQLIKKKRQPGDYYGNAAGHQHGIDHPEYYWAGGYPVGVLAHNYPGADIGLSNRWALYASEILELHIPPAGREASWWNPGRTLPMLLTRPDITQVTWPTEQEMSAMARWRR